MDLREIDILALTSLEYLRTRTAMPEADILSPLTSAEYAAGWSSNERKELHEDYWGRTILDFVISEPEKVTEFERLWSRIQYKEFLTGSSRGKKLVRKQRRWTRLLLGRPALSDTDDLADIPSVPFLFEGREKIISLREMVRLRQQIIGNLIAPLVQADTALFDLGSGWGRHALMFAYRFPRLTVHAGELSLAGQAVTDELAQRFSLPVETFDFNYLEWQDLAERVRNCPQRRIIIFTSHSIEQVTFVDKAMWLALLHSRKEVSFIHIEPVGWQIAANSASCYSQPPMFEHGPGAGYNKNLIAIIDSLAFEGLIRDLDVAPDYISMSRFKNSGTLIRFSGAA